MTDASAPRSSEVPDEVRLRLQRRPQRPCRRRRSQTPTREVAALGPRPRHARLRARRLHQQHGDRARRPAPRRRAARRPRGPGGRPDPALPGDLPDHPPVGLHGDRRRRRRMTATDHRRSTGSAPAAHPAHRRRRHVGERSRPDGRATPRPSTTAPRAVVLDFSGLEYMNSGGIGLLVTLLVRAQRAGVAAARDRPVRPLPPDPGADPPRRGDRDPRRRGGGRRGRDGLTRTSR